MKKRLNIFCVLMLLLLVSQVVMMFVVGSDAFQEDWEQGRSDKTPITWGTMLVSVVVLLALLAGLVSFLSFIRFILNVNRNKVFVWENVNLLRLTAWASIIPLLVFAWGQLYDGSSFVEVYNDFFDAFLFGVFNLIVAEVFAIGLKLQEDQDLTI